MQAFRFFALAAVVVTAHCFKLDCNMKIARLVCSPVPISMGGLGIPVVPGRSEEKILDMVCPSSLRFTTCMANFGKCDKKSENPVFNYFKNQEGILMSVCDHNSQTRSEFLEVAKCYTKHGPSMAMGCGPNVGLKGKETFEERETICQSQRLHARCVYEEVYKLCGQRVGQLASGKFRNFALLPIYENPECADN